MSGRGTPDGVQCEECGCRQVRRHRVEGFAIDECELCGHLEGDADAIERIETIREARRQGIDPEIYPLVRTLGRFPGLRIVASGAGQPDRSVVPFVLFTLAGPEAAPNLERIAAPIALFNRGSSRAYWQIEVEYQRQLSFHLRPAFRKGTSEFGREEIQEAQAELEELARRIEGNRILVG